MGGSTHPSLGTWTEALDSDVSLGSGLGLTWMCSVAALWEIFKVKNFFKNRHVRLGLCSP